MVVHEFRLDGEDDVIFVLIHAIVLSAGISFHRNVPFDLRLRMLICFAKSMAVFFVVGASMTNPMTTALKVQSSAAYGFYTVYPSQPPTRSYCVEPS